MLQEIGELGYLLVKEEYIWLHTCLAMMLLRETKEVYSIQYAVMVYRHKSKLDSH